MINEQMFEMGSCNVLMFLGFGRVILGKNRKIQSQSVEFIFLYFWWVVVVLLETV